MRCGSQQAAEWAGDVWCNAWCNRYVQRAVVADMQSAARAVAAQNFLEGYIDRSSPRAGPLGGLTDTMVSSQPATGALRVAAACGACPGSTTNKQHAHTWMTTMPTSSMHTWMTTMPTSSMHTWMTTMPTSSMHTRGCQRCLTPRFRLPLSTLQQQLDQPPAPAQPPPHLCFCFLGLV